MCVYIYTHKHTHTHTHTIIYIHIYHAYIIAPTDRQTDRQTDRHRFTQHMHTYMHTKHKEIHAVNVEYIEIHVCMNMVCWPDIHTFVLPITHVCVRKSNTQEDRIVDGNRGSSNESKRMESKEEGRWGHDRFPCAYTCAHNHTPTHTTRPTPPT